MSTALARTSFSMKEAGITSSPKATTASDAAVPMRLRRLGTRRRTRSRAVINRLLGSAPTLWRCIRSSTPDTSMPSRRP
jgi:hypothetical protein